MTKKDVGVLAGGFSVGFIADKALLPKVPVIGKYPEVADIVTVLIGWGLTKVKAVKLAGYGFIAVGIGTLIFDLYKRIPGAAAVNAKGDGLPATTLI
ncbi:unnamed protein product [marine sediment metagenome]|uniref:Uncharacterized protein n=1 Tax=marine sediment metagenome TaxID=412755 RepID=X0UFY1_9ZZZZ